MFTLPLSIQSVLDQSLRVLNAMVDLSAEGGSWNHTLSSMHLCQSVVMAWLPTSPEIAQLPISKSNISKLIEKGIETSSLLGFLKDIRNNSQKTKSLLTSVVGKEVSDKIIAATEALPLTSLSCKLVGEKEATSNSDVKVQVTVNLNFSKGKRKCKSPCIFHTSSLSYMYLPSPVVTPHFHKPRDLGWWVVVGDEARGELLALKKLPSGDKQIR